MLPLRIEEDSAFNDALENLIENENLIEPTSNNDPEEENEASTMETDYVLLNKDRSTETPSNKAITKRRTTMHHHTLSHTTMF